MTNVKLKYGRLRLFCWWHCMLSWLTVLPLLNLLKLLEV